MIDTETDAHAAADDPQRELPNPEPAHIGGWPTWLRRTVIGLLLVLALGAVVWGATTSKSSSGDDIVAGAIVDLSPPEGGQALRQTAVGAQLAVGYDGRLTINGIAIPEDQMEGAIDPTSVSAAELEKFGIRPNNRNSVFFKPGPGKAIEEFDHGNVTISLRYFKDRQEGTTDNTVTWTVRVD